jgi:hypothetical protein
VTTTFDPSKHARGRDGKFAAKGYAEADDVYLGALTLDDRLEGSGIGYSVRDISDGGQAGLTFGGGDEHPIYDGYLYTRRGSSFEHFEDATFSVSELPDGSGRVRVVLERESEHEWGQGPRSGIDRAHTTVEVVDRIADPRDEAAIEASLHRIASTDEIDARSIAAAEEWVPGYDARVTVSHDTGYVSEHVGSVDDMVYAGYATLSEKRIRDVSTSGDTYVASDGTEVRAQRNDTGVPIWTPDTAGEAGVFGDADSYIVARDRYDVTIVDAAKFERDYRSSA